MHHDAIAALCHVAPRTVCFDGREISSRVGTGEQCVE